MRLIDTHTHIYMPDFDADRAEVVERARQAGVEKMILPAVDLSSIEPMRKLRDSYPGIFALAAGIHPTELGDEPRAAVDTVAELIEQNPGEFAAVGEIGIDLYWDRSRETEQMDIFERQMNMAARLGLPVIIHCREALDQILEVVGGLDNVPSGVFHSFTGDSRDVDRIHHDAGDFYFGLNGVATFKSCHVTDALDAIGSERLLLETDAPYLAPVPNRGKRNEPSFVADTARFIASRKGYDIEELAAKTSENAVRLFGI